MLHVLRFKIQIKKKKKIYTLFLKIKVVFYAWALAAQATRMFQPEEITWDELSNHVTAEDVGSCKQDTESNNKNMLVLEYKAQVIFK